MKLPISVIILTKDNIETVKESLKSVKFADEIVIIDSFSNDGTIELCKEYNAKIFQHEFLGFAEERNFGVRIARNDWILMLDSDEVLPTELWHEIGRLITAIKTDGILIPRFNFFLRKIVKTCGWYPDYQLKLFRKNKVLYPLVKVHETPIIKGRIVKAKNHLLHYSYRTFNDHCKRIKRYSSLAAEDLIRRRKANTLSSIFLDFLIKPIVSFLQNLLVKKGWKDGFTGIWISISGGIILFMIYVKALLLTKRHSRLA